MWDEIRFLVYQWSGLRKNGSVGHKGAGGCICGFRQNGVDGTYRFIRLTGYTITYPVNPMNNFIPLFFPQPRQITVFYKQNPPFQEEN